MQKKIVPLRTQDEITKNWGKQEDPLVSVVCITYNHEAYISDAIEGFLMQETDFPFEIIIHDDASTDKTSDIVRRYEARYPKLIKGIYQTENQYSQGKKCSVIAWSYVQGEYIALCEGDDYWTDPQKLQIQINEMKKHPEVDMSFHPAIKKDLRNNTNEVICQFSENNQIFPTESFIYGDYIHPPTASLILRREIINHYLISLLNDSPTGDYPLTIIASLKGGGLYINRVMSCYRIFSKGSWHQRLKSRSFDDLYQNYIIPYTVLIERLDELTQYEYRVYFSKEQARRALLFARKSLGNDYVFFRKSIDLSWKCFQGLSGRQIFFYRLRNFPNILRLLVKIRILVMKFKKKIAVDLKKYML